MSTYYQVVDGQKQYASSSISTANQCIIPTNQNIDYYGNFQSIFERVFSNTTLQIPVDPNAIYVLMSSKDIVVTAGSSTFGFCTAFCGFHTYFMRGSVKVKVAWVGAVPASCLRKCGPQTIPSSPNSDTGMNNLR
jgi:hypothetical protein